MSTHALTMDPAPLENAGGLVACAVLGCLVVAIANGANDIANSMGTSFGAGALTLRQAIVYGAAAEFAGAVLLGSSVAKTISKGVINPDEYAADGCEGVLAFAVGMISVLAGTGSTTLLATLYGLPISASHGVIGGLLAVGLVSHGSAGIGWAPLEQTVIAWVASPLLGGITAGALNFVVITAVHRTRAPARRAQLLQPLFVAITVAVAVAFILITGPSAVKVRPVGLAVLISCAAGMAVGLGSIALGPTARLDQLLRTIRRSEAEMEVEIEAEVEAEVDQVGSPTPPPDEELAADAEQPFVPLLILSAMTVAFAHGGNDLGNSIGPLAAVLVAASSGDIAAPPEIDTWVLLLGAGGFVVGIALLGHRTIETVGGKITKLTPSRSFSVQMGTAVAVLSSTMFGLAVSTSHCLVGAVIGVGMVGRLVGEDSELNVSMLKKIVVGWAATIPLAMIVSVLVFKGIKCSPTKALSVRD